MKLPNTLLVSLKEWSYRNRARLDAITWDNQKIQLKNIIASYNPDAKKRILLASHWTHVHTLTKTKEIKMLPLMELTMAPAE